LADDSALLADSRALALLTAKRDSICWSKLAGTWKCGGVRGGVGRQSEFLREREGIGVGMERVREREKG